MPYIYVAFIYTNIKIHIYIYNVIYLYIYIYIYLYTHMLFIYLFIIGHVSCFNILANVNIATVKMEVQITLHNSDFILSRYMPRNEIARSKGILFF